MSTIYAKKCINCRTPLLDDTQRGDLVCPKCGVVHDESTPVLTQSPSREIEEGMTGRASRSDRGLGTTLNPSTTDYAGRKISGQVLTKRMKKISKCLPVPSAERKEGARVIEIFRICSNLGLSTQIRSDVCRIWRQGARTHGWPTNRSKVIAAALVYIVCRNRGRIISYEEVHKASNPGSRMYVKAIRKAYRWIAVNTDLTTEISTEQWIYRLTGEVAETNPGILAKHAISILAKLRDAGVILSKTPKTLGCFCITFASCLTSNSNIDLDKMEVHTRSCYSLLHDILGDHYKITIRLD